MYVLSKKLQILKGNLKAWNKNVFGNVQDHVKTAEKDLGCIQEEISQQGYNNELVVKEREAQAKVNLALNYEQAFWKEKARVQCHTEGIIILNSSTELQK
ncbi:unnamed protein product [Lathyrus sativus]|nr:unnamed protein product [Lathyrus sativus]